MSVLRFKDPATNEWKEITTIMGPAGPQGPKGEDGGVKFEELTDEQKEQLRGPAGHTPVKGTDYFTEADKTELVADVKAQIAVPSSANEISYDNTENQINGIETVQLALDKLFDTAIDSAGVENILIGKGYQTAEQVQTAIATALGNIGVAEEGAY